MTHEAAARGRPNPALSVRSFCAAGTAVVGAAGALLAAMAAGGWSKQVPVMASAVAAVYGIPITLWAVGSVLAPWHYGACQTLIASYR